MLNSSAAARRSSVVSLTSRRPRSMRDACTAAGKSRRPREILLCLAVCESRGAHIPAKALDGILHAADRPGASPARLEPKR